MSAKNGNRCTVRCSDSQTAQFINPSWASFSLTSTRKVLRHRKSITSRVVGCPAWVGPCGVSLGLLDMAIRVIDVRLNLVAQRSSGCSLGRDRYDILPDAPHRSRTRRQYRNLEGRFGK